MIGHGNSAQSGLDLHSYHLYPEYGQIGLECGRQLPCLSLILQFFLHTEELLRRSIS